MTVGNLQGRSMHERSLELAATAVDFHLTAAELRDLESHLAGCPACARRAADMRSDAVRLARPFALLPSSRVDDAVYAAIARQHRRPARMTLLVAAGLLLIGMLGTIAAGSILLRTWQTFPITVVPLPSPSTPVADGSPWPSAPPAVVGETWGSIAIPASDVGNGWIGLMQAVAVTESGSVAVGRPVCVPQTNPTTCHASVWTASPGTGWTRAPEQPGLLVGQTFPTSGPQPGMLDVSAGPGGFVAVGYDYDPQNVGPAIWRSPDGRTWERIASPFGSTPAERHRFRVTAVGASSHGYVIVGYAIAGLSTPAPAIAAHAAAWTSPDGATWTRAADNAAMDVGPCVDTGEEPACGGMRAVVATTTGFVAVGDARSTGRDLPSPAAWTSGDGLTWIRADVGLGFDGRLSGVATGRPGLVAVGTACRPDCASGAEEGIAVTSTDGTTWAPESARGAAPFQAIASIAGTTFALGVRNQDVGTRADLQLWRRTDAVAWERLTSLPTIPDATSYDFADIAATTDRLVIVGWVQTAADPTMRNFSYTSPPIGSQPEPTPRPISSLAVSPTATPAVRPDPAPLPSGFPLPLDAQVVFNLGDGLTQRSIATGTIGGAAVRQIALGQNPSFLFDADRFVFECTNQGSNLDIVGICYAAVTRPGVSRVIDDRTANRPRPEPGPAAGRLTYNLGMIDVGEAWIANKDGSSRRTLAGGGPPIWSADARWLAYQPASAAFEVAIIRPDGSGSRVIGSGYDPTWSRTGARLAYARSDGSTGSIIVVSADAPAGTETVAFTTGSALHHPAWLFENLIAFWMDGDIWWIDLNRSDKPVRMTTGLGVVDGAELSVDQAGSYLLFSSPDLAGGRIHVVNAKGGWALAPIDAGPVSRPIWRSAP